MSGSVEGFQDYYSNLNRRDPFVLWMESQWGSLMPDPAAIPEANSESHRFLALQPIFNRKKKIVAYEVLFRSGWENHFCGDSDAATRMMVDNWILYGFEELTKGFPVFLNCTREAFLKGLVTLLPTTTVLEILEDVEPDEEFISMCELMRSLGYRIALDDFQLSGKTSALLGMADYIKVDFRLSNKEQRNEILQSVDHGKSKLIAEKVESEAEYLEAIAEGFEFFQGYYFSHPKVFSKRKSPISSVNRLRLLGALSVPGFHPKKMTELLKGEASICYRLLRLVNSVAFGLGHEVRSIQSALVMVGEEQFRKLAMLSIATEACGDHREEFLLYALRRARFLELMAFHSGQDPAEQYLFGLLSLMEEMLEIDLKNAAVELPLRQEVKDALGGKTNRVSTGLRILESYEEGHWNLCSSRAAKLGVGEDELTRIYIASLQWATVCCSLGEEVGLNLLD